MLHRRVGTSAALLLALCAVARAAEPLPVLKEIPDNAQGVVTITNIKDFANKLTGLATRLDVPLPQDLIGFLTQHVGVKEGLDLKGSMALVVMPAGAADAKVPEPILLFPTNDPKKLLEPFKPFALKAGVSEVTMPNDPDESGFVAITGNYVAFATAREHLDRFLAKKERLVAKLSPEALAAIAGNDITVYANMPEVSKAYSETLEKFLKNLLDEAHPGSPALDDAMRAGVLYQFKALTNFLTDAQSSIITLRLSDAGISLGATSAFKPDSAWGKFVAGAKPAQPLSLKGLPAAGTLWATGAMYLDSGEITALLTKWVNVLPAEKDLADDEEKAMVKAMKAIYEAEKKMTELSTGGKFVVFAPKDPKKTGYVNTVFLVDTNDADGFADAMAKIVQESITLLPTSEDFKFELVQKKNERTVHGVPVNQTRLAFTMKEGEENSRVAEELSMVNGPQGPQFYTAKFDNRLLVVFSGDKDLIAAAVLAAKTNSDDLVKHAEIQAADKEALPSPSMVAHLAVERWIDFGKHGFTPPAETQAGQTLVIGDQTPTPVTVSIAIQGQSARFELFVPFSTISMAADLAKRELRDMLSGLLMGN